MDPTGALLRPRLQALLDHRHHPKTICPSEVARSLSSRELQHLGAREWRDLMPTIRALVFQARAAREVEILQRGAVIAPNIPSEQIRGPFRVRRLQQDSALEQEPTT